MGKQSDLRHRYSFPLIVGDAWGKIASEGRLNERLTNAATCRKKWPRKKWPGRSCFYGLFYALNENQVESAMRRLTFYKLSKLILLAPPRY